MNISNIKVLITDDHELIRHGLRRIIELEEDIVIVGEADNGKTALDMTVKLKPDIILLDVKMPVMDGIETLQKIKGLSMSNKVIMLTVENDRKTVREAIALGADGYILKDSAGTEIAEAINTVYRGEKYIDKSLVSILFSHVKENSKKEHTILDNLTQREVEVLLKISKGLSNKEIGEELFLSEKTVKNYATSLFKKINASDRVHATIFAIENGVEDYYKSRF
jgi:two-component system, NarL family, response regulator DegU